MTYSFTKPTSKHILKAATKIWGFYFILAFGILSVFRIHLLQEVDESKIMQEAMKAEQERVVNSTNNLVKESERLYYELGVTKEIKERDEKMRLQIENILNLIPQDRKSVV